MNADNLSKSPCQNLFSGCTGLAIHYNSNVIKEFVDDFKSSVLSSYEVPGKFGEHGEHSISSI